MERFKFFLLLFFVCGKGLFSFSQPCIAPYYDLFNQFYVFDNGSNMQLEPLPPLSVKVGRNSMAYINNLGRLKLYYKSKSYPVCEQCTEYYMTDNWFLYKNFGLISVLYGNELKQLDKLAGDNIFYGDSIISWTSSVNEQKIFYNGETTQLEQWAIDPEKGKMSDNIFAYTDFTNNFKVFYHGEKITLEGYEPKNFWVDRDIVAYVDNLGNFKFFYKGEKFETSIPEMPEHWTGEGFFAYFNFQGQLIVWHNGEEQLIAQDRPKDMTIKENIIAFTDKGNNFYVWYKGSKTLLERYQPKEYKIDNDILVYKEQYGKLWGFYFGNQTQISDIIPKTFNLYNYTVTYTLPEGETRVWCNGKTLSYH